MALGTQTAPFTRKTTGTLAATDDTVVLYSPNSASAVVTIDGTFEGSITFSGSIENGGSIEGGRLLFQSGIGSIGSNTMSGYGDQIRREYRILAGGDYIIARASSWVSGSAEIEIHAQEAPNIVFINGPVHNTFEEAQRSGRSYSVGTSTQSVTANNFLQTRFENPSSNARRCFITQRIFSNDRSSGQANLELAFFPSYATPLTGATTVTPNNLRPGGAASPVVFEWAVNTTTLGTPALGQVLPVDGVPYTISVDRIVEPGQSFAYQIGGAGGSLTTAARVATALIWYEEDRQ